MLCWSSTFVANIVGYVSWISLTGRTSGKMGSNISSCILNCFKLMHNLINLVYLGHNVSAYEYCSRNFKFSALLPWDCGLAKLPVVKNFLADPLVGPCHWHATPISPLLLWRIQMSQESFRQQQVDRGNQFTREQIQSLYVAICIRGLPYMTSELKGGGGQEIPQIRGQTV